MAVKSKPPAAASEPADRGYRERVYLLVRRIPPGRVMTYGEIAYILGKGYTPRTVGFVMHGADEANTPWHRVINSQGRCSTGRLVLPADKQQRLLEHEGVVFDPQGRCDLQRYLWHPDRAATDHAELKQGRAALRGRNLQRANNQRAKKSKATPMVKKRR
jgi:methylated-DNA-protein-cysteine methyltransferase-like protein